MTIPKKFIPIGVIAGAVIVGGTLGGLLIAPKILAAKYGPPPGQEEQAKEKEKKKKGGKHGGAEAAPMFEIKNIIVNPAGSPGTHFLMVSLAFETEDPAIDEDLRAHDVQIQDLIISTLESRTVEELTRAGTREELKREFAEKIRERLELEDEIVVYIPQFVIQ